MDDLNGNSVVSATFVVAEVVVDVVGVSIEATVGGIVCTEVSVGDMVSTKATAGAGVGGRASTAGQNAAQQGSSSKKSSHELAERSLFFNPKPSYPLASRRLGEQGAVHLKLCVGSRGLVESVQMTQSSGYQNLDRSAIEAVKAWRFSALSTTSENVLECYQLPIHFQLES